MKYILSLVTILGFVFPSMGQQLNVVVVLDASGSMDASFAGDREIKRMDAAKTALTAVLNSLPANTNVGILVLPYGGWVYPLGPVDKDKLTAAVAQIRANGGTPLGKFMKNGANALIELRKNQKYGIYKLIVVTDGEATDDAETPLSGQYGILSKGILVEAIGVDMSQDHSLATKVPYRSANNPNELVNAVKAIVAETGDGHSEDYDIIAPLDPKMALAAVRALATPDNTPVGMKPKVDEDGNVMFNENGEVILEQVESGGFSFGWAFFVVVLIVTAGVIIMMIVVASRGH